MGIGTKKNCDEAVKWIKHAVEKGNAEAYDNMGSMFEEGCGVEKDLDEALVWFKKSADKGCEQGKVDYARLKKIM